MLIVKKGRDFYINSIQQIMLILLNTLKKVTNLHVNEGTFWQCPNCPAI